MPYGSICFGGRCLNSYPDEPHICNRCVYMAIAKCIIIYNIYIYTVGRSKGLRGQHKLRRYSCQEGTLVRKARFGLLPAFRG